MSFLDNTFNPDFTAPAFTDLDMSASFDLSRPLRILMRAHPETAGCR